MQKVASSIKFYSRKRTLSSLRLALHIASGPKTQWRSPSGCRFSQCLNPMLEPPRLAMKQQGRFWSEIACTIAPPLHSPVRSSTSPATTQWNRRTKEPLLRRISQFRRFFRGFASVIDGPDLSTRDPLAAPVRV